MFFLYIAKSRIREAKIKLMCNIWSAIASRLLEYVYGIEDYSEGSRVIQARTVGQTV